jgi:hypothetical protein
MGKLTNTETGEVTDYPGVDDPFELLMASIERQRKRHESMTEQELMAEQEETKRKQEESHRRMRTIQERVRRAASLPREAALKVKQVLSSLKAKPRGEVGGGPLGYNAYLADEAQRLDPELGQLPREDLEALVTAWAFDGVSILSVDQNGLRVVVRAQNAPGTEQLLRGIEKTEVH